MGLEKPYNGAWQELEGCEKPFNGAYQMCEAVCKPKDGAWEEIWNAILYMKELANTLSSNVECGYAFGDDQQKWGIYSFYEGNASGYVTYYLEGEFSNPTVSFDWSGFFNYETTTGKVKYASAGTIDLYTRTTDGTANYQSAVSAIGSTGGDGEGSFETTLNGEYDRIGFRVTLRNWQLGSSYDYLQYNIDIWNFLIDGKECIPSEECVIN